MLDKKKILIIQPIHKEGIKLLENNPNYEFEIVENIDAEEIKTKISECNAISIRTAKLSGELISGSDMYDKTVKSGNFSERNELPKTIELWNKNILIAGFGRIGQCLIKRCKGFEMNVFVYDPYISKDIVESLGGKKIDNLPDSVKEMDVISLHVPLNDSTKNLINYDLLKTMKKNCIIINASRGGIINEAELDKALNENLIFGAGLDVFETEPPDQNNPLLKNDKVFLSPHTAAFTEECMIRMGKETIQNIIDFFDKKLDKSKIIKLL